MNTVKLKIEGIGNGDIERIKKLYDESKIMSESPMKALREETAELVEQLVAIAKRLHEIYSQDDCPDGATEEGWEDDPIEIPELGLKITSKDYYEILPYGTKKEHFTWDEAMEIENKTDGKWRLPTAEEMVKICFALGEWNGDLDRNTLVKALKLEQKGWADEDGVIQAVGEEGNWWTSTEFRASYSRNLYTGITDVNPQYFNDKGLGFSVRLVCDSVEEQL